MIVTRAPLRIPLGGGGTDFPSYYLKYGGYILSFALDRYVHVVLHKTIDKKIHLKYSKTEVADNPDQLENRVAAEALKWYGIGGSLEVATFSDVPESSGLGGSSSFCVALVTALRELLGLPLDKAAIFASAYDIERNKAGQPGGIQDQYFATFGGAQALELGEEVKARTAVGIQGLLSNLCLLYTGTARKDLGIAKTQTERTESKDSYMVDNLSTVKSIGRGVEELLAKGEYRKVGELFHRHWEVKKQRDPTVTNPTVDRLYSDALSKGVVGGKLIGLGGGGYLLLYTNGTKLENTIPVGLDTEGCRVVYRSG